MVNALERVVGPGAVLGEGPVWDERDGVLWWLDIPGQALHRFDPAAGHDDATALGYQVGALVLRTSGGLVLATPQGFEAFDPDRGERSLLVAADADNPLTRMNDGKCDPAGRFYAGTMAYDGAAGAGAFYRLDPDLAVTKLFGDTTISNGLAWSADGATLYYIDSMTHRVDAFDVDLATGALDGRRPFVHIDATPGVPDGMCIDEDGFLWVALFDGAAVHRYSPSGDLDRIVEVPALQVTCCAFGGPDYDELYITTAAQNMSDEDRRLQPDAGSMFRLRPGVAGPPPYPFSG